MRMSLIGPSKDCSLTIFKWSIVLLAVLLISISINAQSTQEETGKWIYFQTPEKEDAFLVKVTDEISNGYIVTLYAGNLSKHEYPNFAMSKEFASTGKRIEFNQVMKYLKKWGYDNR